MTAVTRYFWRLRERYCIERRLLAEATGNKTEAAQWRRRATRAWAHKIEQGGS